MNPDSPYFTLRPYHPADAQSVVDLVNAESCRTLVLPRAVLDGVGQVRLVRYVPSSRKEARRLDG